MKIKTVTNAGNKILFPAIVKLSFEPLFASLRKSSENEDSTISVFAQNLLEDLKKYPELETGFTDIGLLEKYAIPIEKLLRILFPEILQTNEIKGVTTPFGFQPFYMSTRFEKIMEAAGKDFNISVLNLSDDELYIFVCCVIIGHVYNYNVDITTPFRLTIPDIATNSNRIYRVAFNADMISVVATDKAPIITDEDFALLIERFDDIDLWKKKFPAESYILSGFGIINLMDVTVDQSIAGITANLLTNSKDSFEEISTHLRNIFRKPNLQISKIIYDNDCFSTPTEKKDSGIFLEQLTGISISQALCHDSYEKLFENKLPLIITDTEKYQDVSKSVLAEMLIKKGIGSYIIIPLIYENDFLGFIELASEKKHELSLVSLKKLADVLPVLAMALSHYKIEAKNEMDAIIQQEYTKIHPSVKWRFEEEAKKYIDTRAKGEEPLLYDMDFQNVYPLYGQLDIKGSSTIRNNVIQKDSNTELTAVKNILARAYHKKRLPIYEELSFRVDAHLKDINEGLKAGSEHDIIHFLRKEITPLFEYLKRSDKSIGIAIKKYEDQLDPELRVIYHERKKFDESIGSINKMLSEHLDMRQDEAQQMYPHYFERYKTDGVEFNIYAGASVSKGHVFDKIYIQNLRIWQLIVMSEMENEFHKLKKDLREPLEIASLILIHSDPLTIHFRVDEKRFDVKGAYNARYEIIKSRIDKAMIKGTLERITIPGKLSIIYSNDMDAEEYIRYLNFLTARNYFLKDSLEKYVLDDLQGITGLKALRIGINYTSKNRSDEKVPLIELMNAMEKN